MFPTQIWSKVYIITTVMWIKVYSVIFKLWQLPVEKLVGGVSVWVNFSEGAEICYSYASGST